MELSSKQRAYLRSLSNDLDVIVHIGKDGIGDNLVKQANDALEARELIKCRVLENSMLTASRCRSSVRSSCSTAPRTKRTRRTRSCCPRQRRRPCKREKEVEQT